MQLVTIIRQQIASGKFPGGAKLPSESQMCQTYELSPMTVRRAINLLVEQGLVFTAKGKGTFVKALDLTQSSFSLENLLGLLKRSGKNSVKLLGVKLIRADEKTAEKLALKPGTRIVYIERLIKRNGNPVILHKEYLIYDPRRPIVESEMEVTKLMGLLEGKGEVAFKKGCFVIEAALLEGVEAERLKVPEHFPAFRLEHTFYDFDDKPASWGWFLARGDHLFFTTEVGLWE